MKAQGLAYAYYASRTALSRPNPFPPPDNGNEQRYERQLMALFVTNFIIFFTGHGLLPLLPLYASDFGASSTASGFYLAFAYLAIFAGTLFSSRLADKIGGRRLFVTAGIVGIPALILLGQATSLWQVVLLTAVIWFCGGIGSALVSLFTGLVAKENGRGKSFGLMFLAWPLGALVSGMTVGHLVEWRGYAFMFTAVALLWVLWPLLGVMVLGNTQLTFSPSNRSPGKRSLLHNHAFMRLLGAMLASATAIYIARLGITLTMSALHFSPSEISGTTAVGGLVAIPVTITLGVMSDRLGRGHFLSGAFLLAAVGASFLLGSIALWQFLAASMLLVVAKSASGAIASATATDLLKADALQQGLPWLNAMTWLAGIIGFATAGTLMDTFGQGTVFALAAGLALLPLPLLALPKWRRQQGANEPAPEAPCYSC